MKGGEHETKTGGKNAITKSYKEMTVDTDGRVRDGKDMDGSNQEDDVKDLEQ